jgi:predicted small secreted protein
MAKKIVVVVLLVWAAACLSGCNMIKGFGTDVAAVGGAMAGTESTNSK